MRPPRDTTMMLIAQTIAQRSTCVRRQVGCVMIDKHGRVVSMGHNGVAMGQPHCSNKPCPGAKLPSGTGLDACQAIHAEQNALLFAPDVMKIHTCYVTASPCVTCVKLLLNSSCERIVFLEIYPHSEARRLWTKAKRKWHHLTPSRLKIGQ